MRARPLRDAGGAAHGAGRGARPGGRGGHRGGGRPAGGWQGCLVAWPDGIRGLILLSEAWWAAPCGGGEPPTKVGGLRGGILFESKEYPLALPKKDCQGGWRRHKLHIPRRCPEGTGSLIPLLLLFPPQNFAVGALYFPPDNPLETTKGRASALPLETFPGSREISGKRARALRCAQLRRTLRRGTRAGSFGACGHSEHSALRKTKLATARQISNGHWAFIAPALCVFPAFL